MVPALDKKAWLDIKKQQGGISHGDSTKAGAQASKSPTYATQLFLMPVQSCSKGARGLSV